MKSQANILKTYLKYLPLLSMKKVKDVILFWYFIILEKYDIRDRIKRLLRKH